MNPELWENFWLQLKTWALFSALFGPPFCVVLGGAYLLYWRKDRPQ